MRSMRAIFLSCFFLVPAYLGCAGAQPLDATVASDDCDAFSQAEMRTCLVKASKASADALKNAATSANEAIAKWDESAKYISVARMKLSESSKAFERYRTAQCNWSVAVGGGAIGNALEIRRFRCVNDLNLARIAQIKAMVGDLPSRNLSE